MMYRLLRLNESCVRVWLRLMKEGDEDDDEFMDLM